MKMQYSILWFDDTAEVFDSLDLDSLKEIIHSWGFIPQFELVLDPHAFMAHAPFGNFDLIVVDYNLEEFGEHGQVFIKKIREHDIYTEIIFYSANPSSELWDAIRKDQLEGVFISNRMNVLSKIENVAHQSVKKIVDLENMRGILMAEVGDIDIMLGSMISRFFSHLDEKEKKIVLAKFNERFLAQHETSQTKILSLAESNNIQDFLDLCDSAKKWMLFRSICKRHPEIKNLNFDDYQEMVLKPRNFLAHGTPEILEENVYIFKYANEEYRYDHNAGRDLRVHIKNFKNIFSSLITSQ